MISGKSVRTGTSGGGCIFSLYQERFSGQNLCFSDVFCCDLNDSDNYFCRKSLIVTERWEPGKKSVLEWAYLGPVSHQWLLNLY